MLAAYVFLSFSLLPQQPWCAACFEQGERTHGLPLLQETGAPESVCHVTADCWLLSPCAALTMRILDSWNLLYLVLPFPCPLRFQLEPEACSFETWAQRVRGRFRAVLAVCRYTVQFKGGRKITISTTRESIGRVEEYGIRRGSKLLQPRPTVNGKLNWVACLSERIIGRPRKADPISSPQNVN